MIPLSQILSNVRSRHEAESSVRWKDADIITAINEDDNTASLALAMEVAGYFELDADQARTIAADVGKAVSKWRGEAARHGLTKPEIDRMASAFEHQDLEMARNG